MAFSGRKVGIVTKQELGNMLHQKAASNERLNAALKNCRQQLNSLKLEHDRRANIETAYNRLDSKYTEARKKLASLTLENARLSKANRRSEHQKHDHRETAKRVAKLEAERQLLRLLVRKRIPGRKKTKPTNHPNPRTGLMAELEEENKTLKAELARIRSNQQVVLNEIFNQNHGSERSMDELLEDIKGALQCSYYARMEEKGGDTNKLGEAKHLHKDLEAKLLESQNRIVSLRNKLEYLKESNRTTEELVENLKLINVHLDQQLSAAKIQVKEALQKVSFLEMELEDRSHQSEGLETTCVELQLQLASVSSKEVEQEGKMIQTELEIETNKNLGQHSSLRDHMEADDLLNSTMVKEIISTTEPNKPSAPFGAKNVLPIVASKKRGRKGIELLRKLLFRRKRGGNKRSCSPLLLTLKIR